MDWAEQVDEFINRFLRSFFSIARVFVTCQTRGLSLILECVRLFIYTYLYGFILLY